MSWISSAMRQQTSGITPNNEATSLWGPSGIQGRFIRRETEEPEHDCEQVVVQTYAASKALRETSLENPDWTLFTNGSSFVEQGVCKVGYAMYPLNDTESAPLSPGTSIQLAELTALTRTLELSKGKVANIYTDSKYAFLVLYAHVAVWEERHFPTTKDNL
ncbi:uncharacterized protein LOC115838566 isoform X1 [Nomascus leucogenys]|uniref:uncharacterized protein LOC115838566 isoform X1 n=1 Tax=Nomascus leucogenys TaxID=61853 RepID=UPI00122D5214|nr:uncharacterized protein LOC115838566 isoform X1 [Nomascus leucogenys]